VGAQLTILSTGSRRFSPKNLVTDRYYLMMRHGEFRITIDVNVVERSPRRGMG
jgi:hypothetical protein